MLSTAAGLDFKQHIILVQGWGDRVAALRQWQSVGMVVHFRPGDGFEVPGCPPFCTCAHGGMRVVWSGMMTSPSCSCLRRTPMPWAACWPSIPERGGEPRPRWPCSRTILAACGGPGGGADGLPCHEAVRGVDPGPQGGVGSFMQAASTASAHPSMPSRPGLRCARAWKEGAVLSLPSMWMSTLSFSTELQHRRGLWHH